MGRELISFIDCTTIGVWYVVRMRFQTGHHGEWSDSLKDKGRIREYIWAAVPGEYLSPSRKLNSTIKFNGITYTILKQNVTFL